MSTLKLSGLNSGSSIIKAPDSGSTGVTFTLPASAGTLVTSADVTNKLPLAGGNLSNTLGIINDTASKVHFGDSGNSSIGKIEYTHSNNQMYFKVNDGEKLRILDSGGITFNGDTAAANALDDYEEGTYLLLYQEVQVVLLIWLRELLLIQRLADLLLFKDM